jgi:hypothetical protein
MFRKQEMNEISLKLHFNFLFMWSAKTILFIKESSGEEHHYNKNEV